MSFSRTSASAASSQKNQASKPSPPKAKQPAGKRKKPKAAESWAGEVARHLFNPKDTASRPRIDRRLISRPILQEAPYDGSKQSKPAAQPASQHGRRYPFVPSAADYPYWGTLPVSPTSFPVTDDANLSMHGRYPRTQHPSFGPFRPGSAMAPNGEGSSIRPRDTVIPRRPVGATYRSRPSQRPPPADQPPASPRQVRDPSGFSTATMSKKDKRLGVADPFVWESVSRTLSQQHRLSLLVTPEKSPHQRSDTFDAPSRTSSQRRVLDRFAKDLQNYADATGARGRLPAIPSTATESRNTLHTVDELLPYHGEFQAAGLAITSAEQTEKSPRRDNTREGANSGTSPFRSQGLRLDRRVDDPEDQSDGQGSSASTILHFTEQDDLSHLLVDELPPPKQKKMSPRTGLSWPHRRQQPPPSRLPQVQEDESSMFGPAAPAEPSRAPPAAPRPSGETGARQGKPSRKAGRYWY